MKTILFATLLLVCGMSFGQCPPAGSLKEKKSKDGFAVSSQSRSAAVKTGETYELSFIAQAGVDYRLSAKMANPAAGTITYEVYEMVVEKKGGKGEFKKVKHVLANSGASAEALEFSTDKARKIFVTVTVTGGDGKKPECIGVLIEDKKSTRLGF